MNLKNISNLELRDRLNKLIRTERKITHLVLIHINEFESRKLYAEYGYASMFDYLTQYLGYSETSAYRRLKGARLIKRTPQAALKIESGSLKLTQISQVQKHIELEEKKGSTISTTQTEALLEKLENKNSFQTQVILAQEFNIPVETKDSVQPQQDESVYISSNFSKDQFAELQKAKELLSHVCPDGKWSDVIYMLAKKFNQSKMGRPVKSISEVQDETAQKAKTVTKNPHKTLTQSFAATEPKAQRCHISKSITRALQKQAQYSCEFISINGRRCSSTYQLQIDHKIPLAKGGANQIENLRVLCRTHNNLVARRWGLARSSVSRSKTD